MILPRPRPLENPRIVSASAGRAFRWPAGTSRRHWAHAEYVAWVHCPRCGCPMVDVSGATVCRAGEMELSRIVRDALCVIADSDAVPGSGGRDLALPG